MAGPRDLTPPWSDPLRLSELRGPTRRRLTADAGARERVARALDLVELPELEADLEAAPWLDGARVSGRWRARVVQTCGVTLDPFESALSGEFLVRAVPAGSPHAPTVDTAEVDIDLSSDDPPDVLTDDRVDLAAYVVEHLALEIDPVPRKPDAEFEPPPAERESSPFDVLRGLKDRDGG
jgi:uncharacterized metal-binding protein YceD (DUF177 family)